MRDPMAVVDAALDAEAESLAAVLDETHAAYTRFVIFPSAEAADAVTLYTAATHAQLAWEHATRLVIKSPVKRCGKTRTLEILRELSHRAIVTANASTAALVRSINEEDPPTLVLDEADTVFGSRRERADSAEDLRGILNAGHSRGWPYIRWDPKSRLREDCSTFAMAAMGGIGDLPDTIEDRAVVIPMRRRAPGEPISQWRTRRVVPKLRELRDRLHATVRAHLAELADAEPDVPVEDRAADVWEPLLAIAELAGGDWPERARHACRAFADADVAEDATAAERLLADLEDVWDDSAHVPSATLLERLHAIDEAPWGDWYGRPLSARDLARLLRPFGVRSKNVKVAGSVVKCYRRADLEDAWQRYTRPTATAATAATEGQKALPTSGNTGSGRVADGLPESATASDQGLWAPGSGVADGADERLGATGCPDCGARSVDPAYWGHANGCPRIREDREP